MLIWLPTPMSSGMGLDVLGRGAVQGRGEIRRQRHGRSEHKGVEHC